MISQHLSKFSLGVPFKNWSKHVLINAQIFAMHVIHCYCTSSHSWNCKQFAWSSATPLEPGSWRPERLYPTFFPRTLLMDGALAKCTCGELAAYWGRSKHVAAISTAKKVIQLSSHQNLHCEQLQETLAQWIGAANITALLFCRSSWPILLAICNSLSDL